MVSIRSLFSRSGTKRSSIRNPGPDGLDLLAPDFLADPYPYYRYLRQHDPVHRTRQGSWLLTSYGMQVEAFSHPALGNAPSNHAVIHARNAQQYTSASVAQNILPFLDRPQQIKPRRIIGSVFRAALRDAPGDVDGEAIALLHQAAAKGSLDLIADFAEPLSVATISRLMGLPPTDAAQLSKWAAQFFFLFAPMPSDSARQQTDAGLDAFRSYLRGIVSQRRKQPGSDIISRLLVAEDEDGRLSEQHVIDNCMLLFADGVENVDRGFANTVLALYHNPAEWTRLVTQPALAGRAILEGLRFDPPAQMVARIAREDLELGGRQIRKNAAVLLGVASANRDPAAFPDPDSYKLDRHEETLLTFGRGRHSCIGAPLVRQEMEAAVRALISSAKSLSIDTGTLEYEPRFGHRWLKSLPMRLHLR